MGNRSYLKYKLLKWAAMLFCWPDQTGEVTVKFDRGRPFTVISGGGTDMKPSGKVKTTEEFLTMLDSEGKGNNAK